MRDAETRQWRELALDAQFAAVTLLQDTGAAAQAVPLRKELEAEARERGFQWMLARAERFDATVPALSSR